MAAAAGILAAKTDTPARVENTVENGAKGRTVIVGVPAHWPPQYSLDENGRPTGFATSASDWFWEMDENLRFFCFSERFSAVTGVLVDFLLGKTRLERGQSLRAFANLVRSTHGPIGKSSVYRVGWTSLISPPMPEICHILAYIAAMAIPLPLARHIPPGRIGKDRYLSEVIA